MVIYHEQSFSEYLLWLVADRVFRGDCETRQVYEEGAREIALSVVGGINCEYKLLCWLVACDPSFTFLLT